MRDAGFSLAFNFVMGVVVILLTKEILSGFPLPSLLTMFHFAVTYLTVRGKFSLILIIMIYFFAFFSFLPLLRLGLIDGKLSWHGVE
jgi:hypothetical protein